MTETIRHPMTQQNFTPKELALLDDSIGEHYTNVRHNRDLNLVLMVGLFGDRILTPVQVTEEKQRQVKRLKMLRKKLRRFIDPKTLEREKYGL